ncbi:MAG: glycosyltransferase [candidate division Zixibacteria bacterium]|nr:glycosyltransferase [candidate division Zixibacteria bacterium]
MDAVKTGEDLFSKGKIDEAEKYFQKLIQDVPLQKEAYNNLGVIALQKQNIETAIDYFTRALEIDPFYREALLNFTELARTAGTPSVRIILKRYLRQYPEDREMTEALDSLETEFHKKGKIAFLALPGWDTFLGDIVGHFQKKYEVRTCYSQDINEIEANVIWADIVWLEWANELTMILTSQKANLLTQKQVICRLHSYEVFRGFADRINWTKVDDLIFVADHIRTLVQQQVPQLSKKVRLHSIPNGINLKKFAFMEKERGKKLAFLGSLNYKKGPMLLLHAFHELLQTDPAYQLHIGGDIKDLRYRLYFEQMICDMDIKENLHLDGWVDDVPSWLADKHYIICSSVLEGHPVGLMEAMACGLKPVIHNFVGARSIYPIDYIWTTIGDFIRLVTENKYLPAEYRRFIETSYSLEAQLEKIETIIGRETDKSSGENKVALPETVSNNEILEPANNPGLSATSSSLPLEMFTEDPRKRIEALSREAAVRLQENRRDLAEAHLLRLAKMTGYTNETVIMNLTRLYQDIEAIPAIQNLWKRAAIAALEEKRLDDFLQYTYVSIYAENMFSHTPGYKYARVDEDLNAFIKLTALKHPLKKWVDDHRAANKIGDKLRIGFLLEGFSQKQAPSRTYYPLAEHHDRENLELYFYSRWSLDEAVARKESYDITVNELKKNQCRVRFPERALSPMGQVEYLTRQIVNDGIDILVYQTTYFVPVYNFIAALHPALCQAALEHQQSEYSHEMDLVFTTRKQYPECCTRTAPGVIPLTRNAKVTPHHKKTFGIPETSPLLISVNRAPRYRQKIFWEQLRSLLERNQDTFFMAVGLPETGDLLPDNLAVRKRIITPGFRDDIMECLGMADIYVDLFPSGAGSSLIEAMNAGLPVVYFEPDYRTLYHVDDVSLGTDFIAHEKLAIPHGDTEKWQQTMDLLIHDRELRKQLGRDMMTRARQYEPSKVARDFFGRLQKLYQSKKTSTLVEV